MDNNVIIKRINDWLECYQNKDNGYYNATALLKQYNEHYPEKPKKMIEFLRLENTQKYIGCVLSDGESSKDNYPSVRKNTKKSKVRIITFVENQLNKTPIDNSCDGKAQPNIFGMVKNQQVTKSYSQVSDNQVCDNSHTPNNQQVTQKSRNGEKSTSFKNNELYYFKKGRALKGGGKTPDTYYFAPMLFSKFGTWLSPELERDIHKVLWNNILEYRNEIRQLNPYFTDAIKDFSDSPNFYCKVNAMIQKAVLGKYQPNGKPLDKANENELFRYRQLQNEIVTLIKFNIITDFDSLKIHIRSYYK